MSEPIHLAEVRALEEAASGTFEAFYDAQSETLFRRLWLVTRNRAEAEEIMQEAFLKVWERWDRVGTMDDPVGYLYRTAMNVFRKRHRRAVLALRRTVRRSPEPDHFSAVEDRDVVRRILGSLTPRQRAALVLTEMLGFSAEDAGRALGIQASTVRSLTHKARESARRGEVPDA